MSDNTTLSVQSGGDTIRTDSVTDRSTGTPVETKTQVVKLGLGGDGEDGGLVTEANPLPVFDAKVYGELVRLNENLEALLERLDEI